jgi:hypothetical protein
MASLNRGWAGDALLGRFVAIFAVSSLQSILHGSSVPSHYVYAPTVSLIEDHPAKLAEACSSSSGEFSWRVRFSSKLEPTIHVAFATYSCFALYLEHDNEIHFEMHYISAIVMTAIGIYHNGDSTSETNSPNTNERKKRILNYEGSRPTERELWFSNLPLRDTLNQPRMDLSILCILNQWFNVLRRHRKL